MDIIIEVLQVYYQRGCSRTLLDRTRFFGIPVNSKLFSGSGRTTEQLIGMSLAFSNSTLSTVWLLQTPFEDPGAERSWLLWLRSDHDVQRFFFFRSKFVGNLSCRTPWLTDMKFGRIGEKAGSDVHLTQTWSRSFRAWG